MRQMWMAMAMALVLASCGPRPAAEPAAPAAEQHAEHDEHEEPAEKEGHLELSREQQEKAGITLRAAEVRPVHETLTTTGTLESDPELRVDVTSRTPGRILALEAAPGQSVRTGDPLVVLDSVELAEALLEYRDAELRVGLAERNLARARDLARLGDEARRPLEEARQERSAAAAEVASARAERTATSARLARTRQLLREGIASQQQFEEAESADRASAARVRAAEERLRIAAGRVEREASVERQGLRVARDTSEAQGELERARVDLAHAAEVLALYGAVPGSGPTLTLTAPRAGIVMARPVNEGQAVSADTTLMTIQDTSRLLAWLDLREDQLSRVREGMRLQVTTPALPGRSFAGTVTHLSPELDPRSRTGRARADVPNPGGRLKAQMYVSATLTLAASRDAVTVPAEAVQKVEGLDVVYVAEEGDRFERRAVETGAREGGWLEIRSGLKAGERVVAQGAFMVRAEEQREQIGGHGH